MQNGDHGSEKSFRKMVKYMLIFAKKSYGSLLQMKASNGVMRVGTRPQAMEKGRHNLCEYVLWYIFAKKCECWWGAGLE